MINSLSGTVSAVDAATLFLETDGGIEWSLQISGRTAESLPGVGEAVRVLTYLHHRDDQMVLYGFSTRDERTVFHDLLRVGGIGPRQALRILSGMSVDQLVHYLDNEDVDALSRIPGLGKKTAQKILLTLRGKLSLEPAPTEEARDDIVDALMEMGFERAAAKKAVASLRSDITDGEDGDEGELLRRAIVSLSSQK